MPFFNSSTLSVYLGTGNITSTIVVASVICLLVDYPIRMIIRLLLIDKLSDDNHIRQKHKIDVMKEDYLNYLAKETKSFDS